MAFFVDSLAANNKTYHYRILGISPFGELGQTSNIVSGEGKDDLSGFLVVREGKLVEGDKQNSITNNRLTWEFPLEAEKQIFGFMVSRAAIQME